MLVIGHSGHGAEGREYKNVVVVVMVIGLSGWILIACGLAFPFRGQG